MPSQSAHNALIEDDNYTNYMVSGECDHSGQNLEISAKGTVNGVPSIKSTQTQCNSERKWQVTFNFQGLPEGPLVLKVHDQGNPDVTGGQKPVRKSLTPQLSSSDRSEVSILGGEFLTFHGQNFDLGSQIYVDGVPCTLTEYVDSSTLKCLTPFAAAGTPLISVVKSDGKRAENNGSLITAAYQTQSGRAQFGHVIFDAFTYSSDTLFLGARRTQRLATDLSFFAPISEKSGGLLKPIQTVPKFVGPVRTIIESSDGGYFVGGSFTSINGKDRKYLAKLNSDLSLDESWNPPSPTGGVSQLAISGNELFIAGDFRGFGETTRSSLALWNKANGTANATVRVTEGNVFAIEKDGLGGYYIGGDFSKINDVSANGLAHILPNGNLDTNFIPPKPDRVIRVIRKDGNSLYIGGEFFRLTDNSLASPVTYALQGLAKLSATTGQIDTTWIANIVSPPSSGMRIDDLVIDSTKVYFCGEFESVKTTPSLIASTRYNCAAVDKTSAAIRGWAPSTFGQRPYYTKLFDLEAIGLGNLILMVGIYTQINGVDRTGLAYFDKSSGLLVSPTFNPNFIWTNTMNSIDRIHAATIVGQTLYLGGSFSAVNGSVRRGFAAFDLTTGTLTEWNPGIWISGQSLIDFASDGNRIYTATVSLESLGSFSQIVRIDLISGAEIEPIATNLLVSLNTQYSEFDFWGVAPKIPIIADGNGIAVGGYHSEIINGIIRPNLASIDLSTMQVTAFSPASNGDTHYIQVYGNHLFVTGYFSRIGGSLRSQFAVFDLPSHQLNAFQMDLRGLNDTPLNSPVSGLSVFEDKIYFGHSQLRSVNGSPKNAFAVVRFPSGMVESLEIDVDGTVLTTLIHKNKLYLGGAFSQVNGQNRSDFAAINLGTGTLDPLAPAIQGGTYTNINQIVVSGDSIYLSGNFSAIDNQPINSLAQFNLSSSTLTRWWSPLRPLDYGTPISALLPYRNGLLVGGNFTYSTMDPQLIYALNIADGSFRSQSKSPIFEPEHASITALAFDPPSTLYIGGRFSSINGVQRNGLAAFDTSTNSVLEWNPNPMRTLTQGGIINKLLVLGNDVIIGGTFTSIGGQTLSNLAALDKGTGLAKSWSPNPDGAVEDLMVNSQKLMVQGQFNLIGGRSLRNIAFFPLSLPNSPNTTDIYTTSSINVHNAVMNENHLVLGRWSTEIIPTNDRLYITSHNINTGALLPIDYNVSGAVLLQSMVRSLAINGDNLFFTIDGATGYGKTNFTPISQPAWGGFGMLNVITGAPIGDPTLFANKEVSLVANTPNAVFVFYNSWTDHNDTRFEILNPLTGMAK